MNMHSRIMGSVAGLFLSLSVLPALAVTPKAAEDAMGTVGVSNEKPSRIKTAAPEKKKIVKKVKRKTHKNYKTSKRR